jgi:hypothetical protein
MTQSRADLMPVPPAALWTGAGAVAVAVHLLIVQQGLAAMMATTAPLPPVTLPEIEIMAVALSVAGEERPIETAKPVQTETLEARKEAEKAEALKPGETERLEGRAPAAVAAVAPAATAAAPAARVAAVAPVASAAAAAPSAAPARVAAAVAPSTPAASVSPASPAPEAISSVTPAAPVAAAAPSVATASVAAPATAPVTAARVVAPPPPRAAGIAPPSPSVAQAPRATPAAPVVSSANTVTGSSPVAPAVSARPAAQPAPAARVSSAARVASVAPVAEAVAPVASVAPVTDPVAPVAERVAASPEPRPAESLAPVQSTPEPLAPVASAAPTVVEPVPSLPPPPGTQAQDGIAAPTPDTQAPANAETYVSVLDVLAETPKGACFAALPTLSDNGAFQLEAFAREQGDLTRFNAALEERLGQMPNTTMKAISDPQCAAMGFINEGPSYPRFKLFFEIDQREILSGDSLVGRIGNTSGGFLSFLLIDDEGTVQDLASFLQFVPGGARFSIALSLTAGPVVTQQLLMAISTPARLQTVIEANGEKAEVFFPLLEEELRRRGQTEDVAIVAFSVN